MKKEVALNSNIATEFDALKQQSYLGDEYSKIMESKLQKANATIESLQATSSLVESLTAEKEQATTTIESLTAEKEKASSLVESLTAEKEHASKIIDTLDSEN